MRQTSIYLKASQVIEALDEVWSDDWHGWQNVPKERVGTEVTRDDPPMRRRP